MQTKKQQFRVKPIAAAVGLAMVVPFMVGNALAATYAANVPVNGSVVLGTASLNATPATYSFGSSTAGSLVISLGSNANVINWGSKSAGNPTLNVQGSYAGFNIGTGSTVTFGTATTFTPTNNVVVLNVDTSGNPSTLDGTLTGTSVDVFVANANGIVVGSQAVLTAPVLGLIGGNVDTSALTQGTGTQTLGLSFATAGSISVANGAQLNAGSTTAVLIAGAGTVNVSGTNSALISTDLVIDGGASGTYTISSKGASLANVGSFAATSFMTNAAGNTVNLTTAATDVTLDLGTVGSAPLVAPSTFAPTAGGVYADGSITNNGNIDLKNGGTFAFTGILTNNGIMNVDTIGTTNATISAAGTITSVSAAIYANSPNASNFGSVVNNGTIASTTGFNLGIAGAFTNTSTGQLNVSNSASMVASSFSNSGTITVDNTTAGNNTINALGTVSNTGTMIFGNSSETGTLALNITDANFSNTGTLSLVTNSTAASNFSVGSIMSGTLAGSFSAPTLDNFTFAAGTAAGNTAEINTNAINASGAVTLSGFNVTVDSSVAAGSGSTATVTVGGLPGSGIGSLIVATGATLAAAGTNGTLSINSSSTGLANVSVAGTLLGGTVDLGASSTSVLNNINIGGGITANSVNIYANGVVNQAMYGGTAADNYLDNAAVITPLTGGTTGTVSLSLDATGNHVQTWNLEADGNLSATSDTSNFTTAGLDNAAASGANGAFYVPAANARSQLRLQATGNLVLAGGDSANDVSGAGAFTWPGQIVAIAAGQLETTAAVDNAFTNSGAYNGIFLQGNSLSIGAPIYTNDGAWINFSQTGYGTSGITGNPALMQPYYQLSEVTNTTTGVPSYTYTGISSSSLKTGRQFVSGYVPK